MDTGWIKIHRKILKWEWIDKPNTFATFMQLLLTVNLEDGKYHGHLVKRGQRIISLRKLAKESGLSVQSLRTSLGHLKSTHEITHESHRDFSLITINKFSDYQLTNTPTNTRPTHGQHTANTPNDLRIRNARVEEYKNVRSKEDKNKELSHSDGEASSPAQTMRDFLQMVSEENAQYPLFISSLAERRGFGVEIVRAEVDKFINYWCELTKDGKRQRWQLEKTFEVQRRLTTWFGNIRNFQKSSPQGLGAFIS